MKNEKQVKPISETTETTATTLSMYHKTFNQACQKLEDAKEFGDINMVLLWSVFLEMLAPEISKLERVKRYEITDSVGDYDDNNN